MATKHALQTFDIAHFALNARFGDIEPGIIEQLKKHLLDSIGSLVHATSRPAIHKLIRQFITLGEGGKCCTPIAGNIAADRAAQLYTALIRYPDFMDNFLGKESTCHPSDNIGSLLALGQLSNASGQEFLTAMAVGYAIECRLIEDLPVMIKGFDHTLLLAYSLTAAIARMLELTEEQTAHALGIAGCSQNPLVTCRASYTYEWKGFASSLVAMNCVNIALLAKEDMTGPITIFAGLKGLDEVYGMQLKHEWSSGDFSLIKRCILKSYNSEVHTQSVLEAARELKQKHRFKAEDIAHIEITTFLTCYHIVGGGTYGDRHTVSSKEQADHSLPYTVAAIMLDDMLYPEQFLPDRIIRPDVQALLQRVAVHTVLPLHTPAVIAGAIDPYTSVYPGHVPANVEVMLKNGQVLSLHKDDFHGFFTRPFSWADTEDKFRKLTDGVIGVQLQEEIMNVTGNLENEQVSSLITLLCSIGK